MKVSHVRVWKLSPPGDTWIFAEMGTDAGLTGWAELTGSGHDAAAAALFRDIAAPLLGRDPLRLREHLHPYDAFRFPPLAGKLTATAWSGLAQALWDVYAQAHGLPLSALFGVDSPVAVPLYANLNRGLLRDRSPEAHAQNTETALRAGFVAAKCTPFDEVTPRVRDSAGLENGLQRLRAAAAVSGTERIAIDCHQRFNTPLAQRLLDALADMGTFFWIEDLLDVSCSADGNVLRQAHPGVVRAGGEEIYSLREAVRFVSGPDRPEVYLPDIKYLCGPDRVVSVCRAAEALGCAIAPHNPSGPVSQAFSAHVAAAFDGSVLEYPFLAVPERANLTTPREPVENGRYHLSDRPGIGLAPSRALLEDYGTVLCALPG